MSLWSRRRFVGAAISTWVVALAARCAPGASTPDLGRQQPEPTTSVAGTTAPVAEPTAIVAEPTAVPTAEEEPVTDDAIATLENGQGAVLELNGQKVAVYKDAQGEVVQLSPACPHRGCEVGWNASASTWDCPCHGSRFEADGGLRAGPATEGLAPLS